MPDYTSDDEIILLAGQQAVDLRTDDDDVDTQAEMFTGAIAYATGRVDFYCARYGQTTLSENQWIKDVATLLALRWLCMRRLNEVPAAIEEEYEERMEELKLILEGTATVPRAAATRRPVTVTNTHVDLRRLNGHVRTDLARSTGVARDYNRRPDPGASATNGG